ncbi:hypothetical protein LTR37_003225 [Vermiconidia calcicola]|uniref:Uncharacterized protein n=1 Tax=Vermiconidia calcicola TaxID=1690605 RepID=A0ACC3NQY9_9PEZI|nr:hypothetical protein LTR37_003225 [Vermiconidia calcicola]
MAGLFAKIKQFFRRRLRGRKSTPGVDERPPPYARLPPLPQQEYGTAMSVQAPLSQTSSTDVELEGEMEALWEQTR